MNWLDETGRRYLHRIEAEGPRFLIEIDVSDQEVEEIFRHLQSCHDSVWNPRERRLCVAVAAVNAAAQAKEDETRFIQLFYERMKRPHWVAFWEERHAPAIWQALDENFDIELQTKNAGKYVNSIYRHAGIPARARKNFAAFLARLLKAGGGAFTRRDYQEAVKSYPKSLASAFLDSPAGYALTSYLAKWYARALHGTAADAELAYCWRDLLSSVQEHLANEHGPVKARVAGRSCWEPYLAFNVDEGRLEVRFDRRGVQQKMYKIKGSHVWRDYEPAHDDPTLVSISGLPAKPVTPWWYPGRSPTAVFTCSTGAFISESSGLRPGRYWVATTKLHPWRAK